MNDTIIENEFDRLFHHFGVKTRVALCEKLEVPLGTYDTWKIRGKIPKNAILKIAHDEDLNPDWIKTGEGEKAAESMGKAL